METLTIDTPVGKFVTNRPGRARIFENLGIDYCCGGQRSLKDACVEKRLDPASVLGDLLCEAEGPGASSGPDWTTAPLTDLADHIVETHHAYLRRELPRLSGLLEKVAGTHGKAHPELRELVGIFETFAAELGSHMMKEEQILFPAIRQIETTENHERFHCGSIQGPVGAMMHEHDQARDGLHQMRQLTDGFKAPNNACASYCTLFDSLAELETDMHAHIHKENNILFPRALETEKTGG